MDRRRTAFAKMGSRAVAQEMRTGDPPEFDPTCRDRFRTILETGAAHLNRPTGGVTTGTNTDYPPAVERAG